MTRLPVIAACLAAVFVVSGCAEPRPLPTPTPTPTEAPQLTGDGVLRIGALLPLSGDVSGIGPGLVAAIELAVRDANAAGGYLGIPIEAFYRDAGTGEDTRLESGFADLVARGVDVVIGPSSPALLERLLPLAADAGIAVVASAAPSPTVRSSVPAGALLRTVPGIDREAVAMVQAMAEGGAGTIALVADSDAQGQAVADAARTALQSTTTTISALERADSATNIQRLSFSLASREPDAVVIAAASLSTAQVAELVSALLARGIRGEQLWLGSAAVTDYSPLLAVGALEGAAGVRSGAAVDELFAARLRQSDPRVQIERFAPETYDAVTLVVLAAIMAGDDGGASILRGFGDALSGDVVCGSIGECLDVLENDQTIDYDGQSGALGRDDAGDIVTAELSLFRFDADNRPQPAGGVTLGR